MLQVPGVRDFRIVPPPAAVRPGQIHPAAAVIPPLLLMGRPVRRCRTSSAPTRDMAGQPNPDPVHFRRPFTDRAGGTSLYHFAAILPRTSPVRGRSRPEDLIPPPTPPPGGAKPSAPSPGCAEGGELRCAALPCLPLAGNQHHQVLGCGRCPLPLLDARPRANPARSQARPAPRHPPLRSCLARVPGPGRFSGSSVTISTPART